MLTTSDLYLRIVSPNGSHRVEHFRVWDADRKIAAEQDAARKANDEVKGNGPRQARVDLVGRQDYRATVRSRK